jgi:hypothetical protein
VASLSSLRTLFYAYLGTTSSDPFYPPTTANALINATANKYIADVHDMNPGYLVDTETLSPDTAGGRIYTLPADFSKWLEVRITDSNGSMCAEVRTEELNMGYDGPVFAITGPNGTAKLTTGDSINAGVSIYLKYAYQPSEMSADGDTPSWMPTKFHDLLAREAAIDAYGLGNESAPSRQFVDETNDRRGQFWYSISQRGVQPKQLRHAV